MQRLYVSLGPPKNVNRTVLGEIGVAGGVWSVVNAIEYRYRSI